MKRRREQSPADIYHVTTRGAARQIIFEDDDDREYFLSLIKRFCKECNVEVYAWCLMSNHIHLLLHGEIEAVSKFMSRLLGIYARTFNKRRGRVGHLYQERYASVPIVDDLQLMTAIRYIHQNPLKAGVAEVQNYRWSSYAEYVGRASICATAFPFGVFGGREAFVRLHEVLVENAPQYIPSILEGGQAHDDDALQDARQLLGCDIEELKAMTPQCRDSCLRRLRAEGMSVRQIERLTGIGRGVISRA